MGSKNTENLATLELRESTIARKAEVKDTGKYGLGLFAAENIRKGEIVDDCFDGKVCCAEKCSELPKEVADHAIQEV